MIRTNLQFKEQHFSFSDYDTVDSRYNKVEGNTQMTSLYPEFVQKELGGSGFDKCNRGGWRGTVPP